MALGVEDGSSVVGVELGVLLGKTAGMALGAEDTTPLEESIYVSSSKSVVSFSRTSTTPRSRGTQTCSVVVFCI